ncbi:hypothetical protein OG339_32485 [Streptosporangium sp. NBC_01495]|uniref:hypothetical protein n=1 Tax=Streptosporangium sp. NBC_01495 TaxID=2903899 RepID=UPI002E2EA46F|nr:hypothetical protein [Streptosporangium sp. NBC_01495]
MHVPPSPGSPGEPEILAGPAGEPRKRRKPQRRSGLAIAVFSVLAAALLGGGAVFAFVNAGGDDPRVPPVPDSAQEASQEPEPDQSPPQAKKQKPEKGADAASGAGDTSTGGGDSGAGTGGADESEPGAESAAGRPAEDKPSKQRQSGGPQKPQDTEQGYLNDGPPGYVHPQGPVGGY